MSAPAQPAAQPAARRIARPRMVYVAPAQPAARIIARPRMVYDIPVKDAEHGWSVANFERARPALTAFVNARVVPVLDAQECRRILYYAPVKSGKREAVEYLAMRDQAVHPGRVHAFVSAFIRTADEEQRDELRIHNLRVFSFNRQPIVAKCVEWVERHIDQGQHVVIHVDECDYGAGETQNLSGLYLYFRENPSITFILYSATPQEVLFSGEIEGMDELIQDIFHTGERITYVPDASFCGPARFLDEGLVINATPFFHREAGSMVLTPQGSQIMADLRASLAAGSSRNILILRLSYAIEKGPRSEMKQNKAIYQFLKHWHTIPELEGCSVSVDKSNLPEGCSSRKIVKDNIQWSNQAFWDDKQQARPLLVIIDQTSSRSTEWACHHRVFAEHDYRSTVTFSVVSQAQERVNHYESRYGGFQPIRIYGHRKTFELSANRITYENYMTNEWNKKKLDVRTAAAQGLVGDYYMIQNENRELHPMYPLPMLEVDCECALQDIGCAADVSVSSRVRGKVTYVPVINCHFEPCTRDTFPALQAQLQADFQNPFVESDVRGLVEGRSQGYLRKWCVMEYEYVERNKGWGVTRTQPRLTICYRGDILGVAVRIHSGEEERQDTLTTFRSIYQQ